MFKPDLSRSSWLCRSGSFAARLKCFRFPRVPSRCRCCFQSTCTPAALVPVRSHKVIFLNIQTWSIFKANTCFRKNNLYFSLKGVLNRRTFECKRPTPGLSCSLIFFFLSGSLSLSSAETLLRGATRPDLFVLMASRCEERSKRNELEHIRLVFSRRHIHLWMELYQTLMIVPGSFCGPRIAKHCFIITLPAADNASIIIRPHSNNMFRLKNLHQDHKSPFSFFLLSCHEASWQWSQKY